MGSLHSTTDGDRALLPKVVDESKQSAEKHSSVHQEIFGKDGDIKNHDLIKELGASKLDGLGDLSKLFEKKDASPEDIAKAGKKLDDSISPVAPKDMQEDMKNIHAGVLSGDTKKVAAAIKDIQEKHPEMLKDAIKEMNHQFKENNAGVEMAVTGDGKVLMYKNDPLDMSGNKSALQIDPKDGSVSARPIKVRDDGTVVLEPGEIVNADVDKIAKGIGNTATDNVNGGGLGGIISEKPISKFPDFPEPKFPRDPGFPLEPFEPHHPKDPGLEHPWKPWQFKTQPNYELMDSVSH